MPSTIVVGGQYGSEGKGKIVALCAELRKEPWVVRCGGPNSGHTVCINGEPQVLRQVPAAAGHQNSLLLLSAGCVIDEDLLLWEADRLALPRERLIVDPRAVLVSAADREAERGIVASIGSTGSGTGEALIRRMSRAAGVALAGASERLRERTRVESVAPLLHRYLDRGGEVIIEGTQGFGLSLLHGPDYPYVTSRDTSAAAFVSEVGLSPRQVDEIVMVIRTWPIRVGGPSGDLPQEVSWEEVQRVSGAPEVFPEYTSVTNRLRRVARFDLAAVKRACDYNRPTQLAVMGIDRLDYQNYRAGSWLGLTPVAQAFVCSLEKECHVRVGWVGTGFRTEEAFRLEAAPGIGGVELGVA
jgi:adenylosuccinate synthase